MLFWVAFSQVPVCMLVMNIQVYIFILYTVGTPAQKRTDCKQFLKLLYSGGQRRAACGIIGTRGPYRILYCCTIILYKTAADACAPHAKRAAPTSGRREHAMKETRQAEGHILRLLKKGRRSLLGVVFSRTGLVTLALLANLFLLGLLFVRFQQFFPTTGAPRRPLRRPWCWCCWPPALMPPPR